MSARRSVMVAVVALGALVGCDRSGRALAEKVVELEAVSAQKDSLLQEVMSTTQFVGDLAADLASVRALTTGRPVAGGSTELESASPAEQRAALRERVRELTSRMEQSEARLSQSQSRVTALTRGSAQLRAQLAGYDSTITALQVVVESQREELMLLSAQVQGLSEANVALSEERERLTAERAQLTDAVTSLTTAANTVYWIAGSEKELLERGIIVKRGGILGARATIVPARTLDPADFIALDKLVDTILVFPKADQSYRFVSLQDTRYLAVAPDRANRLRTGLQVASAVDFWAASRFLILVED
jgi:FtsZ-binding cell division protein ZapB